MSETKLCKKCRCYLKTELFRDGETCRFCRERVINKALKEKNGRNKLKNSIDYFWVFRNLTGNDKCCFVSKMLYNELCMIDKRFLHIKKKDCKPVYELDQEGYILVNSGEKWLILK